MADQQVCVMQLFEHNVRITCVRFAPSIRHLCRVYTTVGVALTGMRPLLSHNMISTKRLLMVYIPNQLNN
jgi:hypothetical protein